MKIPKETRLRWRKQLALLLHEHYGKTLSDVTTTTDAWRLAYHLEIPREAYHIDRDTNDNHIESALRWIFPNLRKEPQ